MDKNMDDARRPPDDARRQADGLINRRRLLQGAGASAFAVVASPTLSAYAKVATKLSIPDARAAAAAVPASIVSELKTIFKPATGKKAGQGLSFKPGMTVSLSGVQAHYGSYMLGGFNLACAHIEAIGGPKITALARDAGDANVSLGVAAERDFGTMNMPFQVTAQGAVVGSQIPFFGEYEIFCMDASGVQTVFYDKPYYYMTGTETLSGTIGGIVEYMQKKFPTKKNWVFVQNDYGTAANAGPQAAVSAAVKAAGLNYKGAVLFPSTTTDFSATFTTLQPLNPDVIIFEGFGPVAGTFYKQYATSGLKARVIGNDFDDTTIAAAGSALKDAWFALAYFNYGHPPNPLARVFASEYHRTQGQPPGYYSAFYYEIGWAFWQLIQTVIAMGKNPLTPHTANYVAALQHHPAMPSVFGPGTGYGTYTVNPSTHGVANRAMSLVSVTGAKPAVTLATFNEQGKDFKLVS